jgi:hypothetical protein
MRATLLEHGVRFDSLETEMRAGSATVRTGTAQIVMLLGAVRRPRDR